MTADYKTFRTYAEQVELLICRGMEIADKDKAIEQLHHLNYYRLSGYWYPMREFRDGKAQDSFKPGASFELVVKLYRFDEQLRHLLFCELTGIELAIRALLGHELGRIDPYVHEILDQKSKLAKQPHPSGKNRTNFDVWKGTFDAAVKKSREDFVKHHRYQYAGRLPVWAAVEVMDWGMLSHLYRFSPRRARDAVAQEAGLSAPQFESWMRSLNVLRNYAAHNARVFNRVFDMNPKESNREELRILNQTKSRFFGQATMVQYLLRTLKISDGAALPNLLKAYPHNDLVPFSRTGAPEDWQLSSLWD